MTMSSSAPAIRLLRTDSLTRRAWHAALAAPVVRWIVRAQAELRLRRDIEHLKSLDDHLLSDIGLDRRTIECCARWGRLPRQETRPRWP
jgi:uncharacterized protein YjiS (DUF1127 family)